MNSIININGVETKVFAKTFEEEAQKQIERLVNFQPYNQAKVRIMPDAHAGKGCTVGTTIDLNTTTIEKCVTPNLVGVDIGCGMGITILKDNIVDLIKLDRIIRKRIPSGFGVHGLDFEYKYANIDAIKELLYGLKCKDHVNIDRALQSIGTLGGGNHFIELGVGVENKMQYLTVHSGSRNLGVGICSYYQKLAEKNCCTMSKDKINATVKELKETGREMEIQDFLKSYSNMNNKQFADLAYLTDEDYYDYMNDMKIAQEFAYYNRITIAKTIIGELGLNFMDDTLDYFETIHNYIDFNRMILRKSAVSAELGEQIIIPINMKDGSLLCIGRGNEDWNYSAPHGAGRLMSRKKANANLNMDNYINSMNGIYTTSICRETLDEAPEAYKPMDEIIECISDTALVVDIIKPIYNYKAH